VDPNPEEKDPNLEEKDPNLVEKVLWEQGPVCCSRLAVVTRDQIEITLSVNGVCIERRVFADSASAASYALEKMRAYNPR
jgi:hypothetical protein